jgi:hypothetical protein
MPGGIHKRRVCLSVASRRVVGSAVVLSLLSLGSGAVLAYHGDAVNREEWFGAMSVVLKPTLWPSRLPFARDARSRTARDGAFSVSDIRGISGRPTAIPVSLPSARSADYSLLMIRGLPKTIALSSGFRFEDSWAVSLSDVESLAMLAPSDFDGRFNLEVQLIKGQDQAPEKLSVAVEIRPRTASIAPAAGVVSQTTYGGGSTRLGERERIIAPAIAPAPAAPQKVSAKEEASMMEQGNRLLQTGDITAARMVFERIGRKGSALGAYGAGLTFDPEYFKITKVVGLRPDAKKAKEWYKKAADLGNQEAVKRLSSIGTP